MGGHGGRRGLQAAFHEGVAAAGDRHGPKSLTHSWVHLLMLPWTPAPCQAPSLGLCEFSVSCTTESQEVHAMASKGRAKLDSRWCQSLPQKHLQGA